MPQKWTSGDIVKLAKICIQNFRSLKNLQVDLEEYMSIIVGKNNSGKTSLLLILERFLASSGIPRFDFNDFNTEFQNYLVDLLEEKVQPEVPYPFCGISLRLFIQYDDHDDLANVGNAVVMDLAPENKWIILDFLYQLSSENLASMKRAFQEHKDKKAKDGKKAKDARIFLREEQGKHFKPGRRSVRFDHISGTVLEDEYVDLLNEAVRIDDIISFKRINARRSVSNKDSDRSLSTMSAKIYNAMASDAGDEEVFETFKEALSNTDDQLDGIYANLFKEVISDVRSFGGIKEGDTEIKIRSTLQHRDLLQENTTVMYGQGLDLTLPENHNGLGYLNLISIIFEIKIILNEFKRGQKPRPADINLLFIEEPEAHTHPQMQAIFIANIKRLVGRAIKNADGISRPLQTILSTHSSHIVAESDFDDIKYFRRIEGHTQSRSLKELDGLYKEAGNSGYYAFLKQYLTLNRSQLFFADKAILVEGDTERILLPAMMRKIDQADAAKAWEVGALPPVALLSQNISVIEVGAHSQIYEIFLQFIGVKTLIVTDIDSAKEALEFDEHGAPVMNKQGEQKKAIRAHEIENATHTTNAALRFFHGVGPDISYFLGLSFEQKAVWKDPVTGKWGPKVEGQVLCAYQILENDGDGIEYHARSFEDAFFHVNRVFISNSTAEEPDIQKVGFPSLVGKHLKKYLAGGSSFEMAEYGITRKPSFAIEILLNSVTSTLNVAPPLGAAKEFSFEFNNWSTPGYIEEGLRWIKAG
ncbi:ATP-dependent nuclease [Agrobacterium tumefaciens]|uniref:ATP-dependent nuclease n=1 Tax=Agrobacterium tumefaciens TaxID=358 RepID=UPI001573F1A3|nr:ATP-dependent endonuclease [Agrobacterium tumefaciens]NTA41130.1 AAA family ATPase [Agrobacterium tumefaciens]WIE33869.1 ATP-dependent endonuclease [Agrobacterium tumefaciens]